MLTKIKTLLKTLEKIEVRGKDNMDMLLGCMLTLERMEFELEKQAAGTEADTENG